MWHFVTEEESVPIKEKNPVSARILDFSSNKYGENTWEIVIDDKRMSRYSFHQIQGGYGYGK